MLSSSDEEHTCSYHQHHHIIATTSRMQLFGCITFVVCFLVGAYRHAAADVGGSEPTTVVLRTSKALGRGPFLPVAHPRSLEQSGARAPLVAGVGEVLGLGLGPESLDQRRLEWRSMVVARTPLVGTGAYRPVPPKCGQ